MMRLFGKAKAAPKPQETIAKLRETLDMLEKREKFLEKKVEKEILIVRQNATKNRRLAIMALKRKKMYENQMEKIAGARMTIETQVMAIEGANVSFEAINTMRLGARTLQHLHQNMTVEDVEDTMADIQEQMDISKEIHDAIAQPLGGELFDDDELEAELAQLGAESLNQQFLDVGDPTATTTSLPSAPTQVPESEDKEFAELEALMSFS